MKTQRGKTSRLQTNAKTASRSGQVIVIVAVMMVALIAILGLVTDSGLVMAGRRQARHAADAAAQAGAWMLTTGTNAVQQTNATVAAIQYAGLNGISTHNVLVEVPPRAGSNSRYIGSNNCIFVQVTLPVNTTFLRLLSPWKTVNVRAAATAGTPPTPVPITLEILNPTMSGALSLKGNASISISGGAVVVDSSSTSAISMKGNAGVTATAVDVVGNYSGGGITGQVNTGAAYQPDLLAKLGAPVFTNNNTAVVYPDGLIGNTSTTSTGTALNPQTTTPSGTVTLQPGIYWGGISLGANANVTFAPGRYVLAGGGLSAGANASATGANVFFYNTDDPKKNTGAGSYGPISLGGGASLNVSAPTTAADSIYAGLIFFNDRASTQPITIGGNSSNFQGYIYAPGSALTMSGNGYIGSVGAIVDSATLTGTPSFSTPNFLFTPGAPTVQLLE